MEITLARRKTGVRFSSWCDRPDPIHMRFVGPPDLSWVICLNSDSRYCYETLDAFFSCPVQEAYPDDPKSHGSPPPQPNEPISPEIR